jgi:hypothetical protein
LERFGVDTSRKCGHHNGTNCDNEALEKAQLSNKVMSIAIQKDSELLLTTIVAQSPSLAIFI